MQFHTLEIISGLHTFSYTLIYSHELEKKHLHLIHLTFFYYITKNIYIMTTPRDKKYKGKNIIIILFIFNFTSKYTEQQQRWRREGAKRGGENTHLLPLLPGTLGTYNTTPTSHTCPTYVHLTVTGAGTKW